MRIPRLSQALGVALLTAMAAGCTGVPETGTSSGSVFSETLVEARDGGAGDAQLADLEEAVSEQEISIETAREAARRTVQCMNDAGLDAGYVENTKYSGLVVPGYHVSLGTSGSDAEAQIQACDVKEGFWVNMLYQTQPIAIEAKEEFADQQEPVLRACLEGMGIDTDPEASGVDLVNQSLRDSGFDCLAEAGITSW